VLLTPEQPSEDMLKVLDTLNNHNEVIPEVDKAQEVDKPTEAPYELLRSST
jgi:hypothetical protein